MSFCVAGVALCDSVESVKIGGIGKFRTKCSFCCADVSRLESLVFLWRRRVYGHHGKAAKLFLFEGFQAGCHVTL